MTQARLMPYYQSWRDSKTSLQAHRRLRWAGLQEAAELGARQCGCAGLSGFSN
jgi:hypothetical protein